MIADRSTPARPVPSDAAPRGARAATATFARPVAAAAPAPTDRASRVAAYAASSRVATPVEEALVTTGAVAASARSAAAPVARW